MMSNETALAIRSLTDNAGQPLWNHTSDMSTPEKVPGTRTKKQTVLIHWNFIGAVELPQEQKKSA